jgi:sterol desaturase/sphingolipid hydroxylase (fatty acid hydroxylase superfamily)
MFFFLSWYTHRPSVIPSLVTCIGDTPGSRLDHVRETNDKVPYLSEQLWGSNGSFVTMCGPNALFGGIASSFVMSALVGMDWPALTLWSFFLQLVSLYVLGDLGLYWCHRVQHEMQFLYRRFHSIHHTIKTPIPLSASYIHPADATLQTSLTIIAAALVRSHPASCYAYVSYSVAEHALNHSGLDDGSVLNALLLKF